MHSAVDYADYATNNWTKSIARLMKRSANNPIIWSIISHVATVLQALRQDIGFKKQKKKNPKKKNTRNNQLPQFTVSLRKKHFKRSARLA